MSVAAAVDFMRREEYERMRLMQPTTIEDLVDRLRLGQICLALFGDATHRTVVKIGKRKQCK